MLSDGYFERDLSAHKKFLNTVTKEFVKRMGTSSVGAHVGISSTDQTQVRVYVLILI
jgi:hypothetical protein